MPALGRVDPSNRATATQHNCAGCVTCDHPSAGPPLHGSPTVFVDGTPALRATGPQGSPEGGPPDGGTHDAGQCCGDNKWICAIAPDRGVYINGLPAFCATDKTQHDDDAKPADLGTLIISGQPDVFVGDGG
jgi:hypothetical protein